MFGIGPSELFIIAIVLIIFIKPEDVPLLLRKVGQMYGQFSQLYRAAAREINEIQQIVPTNMHMPRLDDVSTAPAPSEEKQQLEIERN